MDGALMLPGAIALCGDYKNVTLPVVIIAGDGDKVVFKRRSERLRDSIRGSVLQVVKGAIAFRARTEKPSGAHGPPSRAAAGGPGGLSDEAIATVLEESGRRAEFNFHQHGRLLGAGRFIPTPDPGTNSFLR
jgi:hypothetical protein